MILTVLRVCLLNLRRDGVAWVLGFIVPVIFFSIMAYIFGSMGGGRTPKIELAVVDEDQSELSKRLIAGLEKEASLIIHKARKEHADGPATPYTRADGEELVRAGKVPVVVIVPRGLGKDFPRFDGQGSPIELLVDSSNPVAGQMLTGLLQKVVMTGMPEAFMTSGISQFEKYAGGLTEQQRKAIDAWLPMLKQASGSADSGSGPAAAANFGLIPIKSIDLFGAKKKNPAIAFYAAATAVMFLLFATANGGGGSFLEEVESGTLDRLLSSNLTLTQLVLGKWLWFTLVGIAQVTVMFIWGALVFQVQLLEHLAGFVVMTVTTAAAASSFGLVLGTLCKTRGQLAGLSTTVILLMSAVGGSMFPRFLMPPIMKSLGLFTFNGWALDGYQKVFWFEQPLTALWPQVLVLALIAVGFLFAARKLARRWASM
jgi:ABC-2 type transport system permease protein